jgi:Na+/H+ antiporter NhaD/arsenite permease-like protein
MLIAAFASWHSTHEHIHKANQFDFHPIKEVAILFLGIFATMMPALDWLQHNAPLFGTPTPGLYYWGTGTLSSVLDNAPTYLTFLSAAIGTFSGDEPASAASLLSNPEFNSLIVAISIGAVFFGANTYIGNGPNFMVKAIADQQKVHAPTFLGFIFKYTLPFMLPMLILIWLLFFRK